MYLARWAVHSSVCSIRIANEAPGGCLVWKDADDVRPPLDLAVQPLDRIGAV